MSDTSLPWQDGDRNASRGISQEADLFYANNLGDEKEEEGSLQLLLNGSAEAVLPGNGTWADEEEGSLLSEYHELGYVKGEVYLLNQPIQCFVISVIIVVAVIANLLVIHNISTNQLKLR